MRSLTRAVDLPTVRDQLSEAVRKQLSRGDAEFPEHMREFQRQARRRDFALWWVTSV